MGVTYADKVQMYKLYQTLDKASRVMLHKGGEAYLEALLNVKPEMLTALKASDNLERITYFLNRVKKELMSSGADYPFVATLINKKEGQPSQADIDNFLNMRHIDDEDSRAYCTNIIKDLLSTGVFNVTDLQSGLFYSNFLYALDEKLVRTKVNEFIAESFLAQRAQDLRVDDFDQWDPSLQKAYLMARPAGAAPDGFTPQGDRYRLAVLALAGELVAPVAATTAQITNIISGQLNVGGRQISPSRDVHERVLDLSYNYFHRTRFVREDWVATVNNLKQVLRDKANDATIESVCRKHILTFMKVRKSVGTGVSEEFIGAVIRDIIEKVDKKYVDVNPKLLAIRGRTVVVRDTSLKTDQFDVLSQQLIPTAGASERTKKNKYDLLPSFGNIFFNRKSLSYRSSIFRSAMTPLFQTFGSVVYGKPSALIKDKDVKGSFENIQNPSFNRDGGRFREAVPFGDRDYNVMRNKLALFANRLVGHCTGRLVLSGRSADLEEDFSKAASSFFQAKLVQAGFSVKKYEKLKKRYIETPFKKIKKHINKPSDDIPSLSSLSVRQTGRSRLNILKSSFFFPVIAEKVRVNAARLRFSQEVSDHLLIPLIKNEDGRLPGADLADVEYDRAVTQNLERNLGIDGDNPDISWGKMEEIGRLILMASTDRALKTELPAGAAMGHEAANPRVNVCLGGDLLDRILFYSGKANQGSEAGAVTAQEKRQFKELIGRLVRTSVTNNHI